MAALVLIDPPPVLQPGQMPQLRPAMLALSLLVLVGIGWCVALEYRGFVTASGLKGARRWIAFVVAALSAEILAKMLLFFAYRSLGLL